MAGTDHCSSGKSYQEKLQPFPTTQGRSEKFEARWECKGKHEQGTEITGKLFFRSWLAWSRNYITFAVPHTSLWNVWLSVTRLYYEVLHGLKEDGLVGYSPHIP